MSGDGKMDAQGVAALIKDYNVQLVIAQEKVENNIKNIETIRSEMREATRELKEAKEIYDASLPCYLSKNWWKILLIIIAIFVGLIFLFDGKDGEISKGDLRAKITKSPQEKTEQK
jgi:hypothetical protein